MTRTGEDMRSGIVNDPNRTDNVLYVLRLIGGGDQREGKMKIDDRMSGPALDVLLIGSRLPFRMIVSRNFYRITWLK